MRLRNTMTMKMKLNPEVSCLETQEKFWRGRLKEISDKYDAERRNMQDILFQITAENQELKKELEALKMLEKRSVHVQTSSVSDKAKTICERCQQEKDITVICDEEKGIDFHKSIIDSVQANNFSVNDASLPLKNSSFVMNENFSDIKEHKKKADNVEKTITKLFPSDNRTGSEKIASKLIELYEKRNKLIPEINYEADENLITNHTLQNDSISEIDVPLNTNSKILDKEEKTIFVDTTMMRHPEKHSKINKIKFLPVVDNVRKKVLKNFSRIKRSCVNIKAHSNNKLKLCTDDISRDTTNDYLKSNINSEKFQSQNDESKTKMSMEEIAPSPKCQLISAMKKSKSTGNIVKKVAFLDELPSTSRAISESNLLDMENYKIKHSSETPSLLEDAVHVHHDKYAKPIPAPRSKKNIIITY